MPSSKKRQVSCRVSEETYQNMMELIGGPEAAFESTSEYMYTLIISDLARRKAEKPDLVQVFLELLNNPDVVARLKSVTT